VFNIIKCNNDKYTLNNDGVAFDYNDLTDKTLYEIAIIATYYTNKNNAHNAYLMMTSGAMTI